MYFYLPKNNPRKTNHNSVEHNLLMLHFLKYSDFSRSRSTAIRLPNSMSGSCCFIWENNLHFDWLSEYDKLTNEHEQESLQMYINKHLVANKLSSVLLANNMPYFSQENHGFFISNMICCQDFNNQSNSCYEFYIVCLWCKAAKSFSMYQDCRDFRGSFKL